MLARRKARRIAVQALYSWEMNRVPVKELLTFEWMQEKDRADADVNFARILTSGTIEQIDEIDSLIDAHLDNWNMDRVSRVDLAILRISTYSLRYQPDIAIQITIDEAIELARSLSTDDSFRFINGVLDAVRKTIVSGRDAP